MEQAIRELLDSADDTEHAEYPPGFGWLALQTRVRALQPVLETIAGCSFVLDDGAQDASFFGDLSVHITGERPNHIDTIFAVRFSNFGDLFTTWHTVDGMPTAVATKLVEAVQTAGFRFIPSDALQEPYTGRSPGFRGAAWGIRYFDYL